jgi:hypothetical protein
MNHPAFSIGKRLKKKNDSQILSWGIVVAAEQWPALPTRAAAVFRNWGERVGGRHLGRPLSRGAAGTPKSSADPL